MKIKVTAWFVPICDLKGKWTVLPKVYRTKGFAKSAITNRHLEGEDGRSLEPISATAEFEAPSCDDCVQKFKCFTQRRRRRI